LDLARRVLHLEKRSAWLLAPAAPLWVGSWSNRSKDPPVDTKRLDPLFRFHKHS